jgi:hypothetical protein
MLGISCAHIGELRFLFSIYITFCSSQITLLSTGSFNPNSLVKQAKIDIITILEMRKSEAQRLFQNPNPGTA